MSCFRHYKMSKHKFPRRGAVDKATTVRETKQSTNSKFRAPNLFVILLFKCKFILVINSFINSYSF